VTTEGEMGNRTNEAYWENGGEMKLILCGKLGRVTAR
jgi:hypothetical protein